MMNKSELFEVMGLGPVWTLRHVQNQTLEEVRIVAVAPGVPLLGTEPDTTTAVGLLLSNVLAMFKARPVICCQSFDDSRVHSANQILAFATPIPDSLPETLYSRLIQLPTLESMLTTGSSKYQAWRNLMHLLEP
ncbi:hypothetical protein [Limnobacter litoralis]|uniref:Uncharacterized protein n=1 Tax=Limnobacter litoralis TaxID=481366 RepID=A0ABQ5YTI1_9BURK|nr:hypothetical protein [Limnobacter litoralis]GLR26591.1 hypothetical protein GCM10007875_16810 [Limnobacter litoralis]